MWAVTLILALIFPPTLFVTIPLWGIWILNGISKQKRNDLSLNLMNQEEDRRKAVYDAYVKRGGEPLSLIGANSFSALKFAARGGNSTVVSGDQNTGYRVVESAIKEFNKKAREAKLALEIREAEEEKRKTAEAKTLAEKREIDRQLQKAAFEKAEFYCESPAELEFLKAIIQGFGLAIGEDEFTASGMHLKTQVEINGYRVDFLFNRKFIVEVDGREYHTGQENAMRDARRDSSLRVAGYRILRIPAYRVFHSPRSAVADVRDFLEL